MNYRSADEEKTSRAPGLMLWSPDRKAHEDLLAAWVVSNGINKAATELRVEVAERLLSRAASRPPTARALVEGVQMVEAESRRRFLARRSLPAQRAGVGELMANVQGLATVRSAGGLPHISARGRSTASQGSLSTPSATRTRASSWRPGPNPSLLFTTYSHVIEAADRTAADRLGQAFA